MNPKLSQPPVRLRAPIARGIALATSEELPVDPKGGDYGAGLIRGAAIITRGEALGHEFWVDADMLQQVHDAINANPKGFKSRFAHPGMSGDGVGKVLGRAKNATRDGDITRADIHFLRTAHKTPDGDLAEYTMELAAEDPEMFGTSIVFEPDIGEEERFAAEHMDEDGGFVSPDPLNEKHLRHARLGTLWAADVVDEPAANPGGMFSRGQEVAYEANALLEYAMGLTDTPPAIEELGIDPTRVRHFFARFLETHSEVAVSIHKEPNMAANSATQNDAQSVQVDADALRAEGAKSERERFAALAKAFNDPTFVSEMFDAGKTVEQAQPLWMQRELDRLTAENEALKAKLAEGKEKGDEEEDDEEDMPMMGDEEKKAETSSGVKPAKFNAKASGQSKGDFMSLAREKAKAESIPLYKAMAALAKEHPQLYVTPEN